MLAEADGGMSLPEIVAATGLKRPTVHNLLRTLMSREFVTKADGLFRVGPSMHLLAATDSSGEFLRQAEEELQALARRFPEAIVSFSEPIGARVFARFHKYPHRLLLQRNAGMEMPPYQTASGLAVLGFADPETRYAMQAHHPFEIEGVALWQTEDRLERFLADVRKRCYVVPPFCNASNYVLAAVPVLSDSDRVLGVFGIARRRAASRRTGAARDAKASAGAGPRNTEYTTEDAIAAMREAAVAVANVERGARPTVPRRGEPVPGTGGGDHGGI